MCERPFVRGSGRAGVRSNLLPKSGMVFRRPEGPNGQNGEVHGRGRARWIAQAAVHI